MGQFILSGFSDEISPDFAEQLRVTQELGIAYIEIRGVNGRSITDHSLDEVSVLRSRLDSQGIGVSAIGSPIGKIKIEDDFESHFETFKHTVEIANILGTRYVRIFSFFMEKGKAEQHREEVLRRLRTLVDYAEQKDIILLHENEKDIYGDTAERCKDLYETLNSDNFRLIFDPANFVQCGVRTFPDAYEMLKDKVIYYHIKDAISENGRVVPSGKGDGHLPEIIKDLRKSDYEGFLSIEPHLGDFVGFSDLEGDGDIPEFEEASDADKFKLAYESLMAIIEEVSI